MVLAVFSSGIIHETTTLPACSGMSKNEDAWSGVVIFALR
jgi:hypothetical protein